MTSESKVNKTLQNLFNKNNLFGFFLLKYVNEELNIFENDEAIVRQLLIFETNDKQIDFALQFKNSIPNIKKNIRKTITAHKRALKKAEKPIKEKVVRTKKVSQKPKKEKKNKNLVSSDDHLVNELVELANDKKHDAILAVNQLIADVPPITQEKPKKKTKKVAEEPKKIVETEEVVPDKVEKKTKTAKKTKKVVEEPKKVVETEEVVDSEKVVEKPKKKTKTAKKTKKTDEEVVPDKVVEEPDVVDDSSQDDEEELAVSVFEFQNKQYLIDDDSVVYDFLSHDEIGKFVDGNLILI